MVSLEEIREFADRIVREFHPDRIILFGSYADGTATEDSDVDLLVVMPHEGKSWECAATVRSAVRPPFPVDLLVRSPLVLQRHLSQGDVFLAHVVRGGTVLHET